MPLSPGTRLGPYEIVGPLGAGGMGDVYRARDVKLQRDVAIKLVAAEARHTADSVERLQREARAIAALNHPNVVTIYGVDEVDGRTYIAMELVDGASLADLLPPHGFTLELILKYAIPAADALSAAHAQGITHRDLKPSNVMVTKDGRVKVLDFGLAKLRDDPVQIGTTVDPTRPITAHGQIVGTVAYMSPEQASAGPVDHRSDLFSFGVMLYEMATGRRPFCGDSSMSVLAAILKDAPAPLADVRPDMPRDLVRIVRRALAKDPDQRYQTAKDLRNDLQTLKDDLASGELVAPAVPQPAGPRVRAAMYAAVGAAAFAMALSAFLYFRARGAGPSTAAVSISRVTSSGKAAFAAISPDGRYIVHVVADRAGGGSSLWVRQTKTGSDIQIAPPSSSPYIGLTFSPDGELIYTTRFTSNSAASVFRRPVLGGDDQFVVSDVDSPLAISADGKRYVFMRGAPQKSEAELLVGPIDGSEKPKILAVRRLPDAYPLGSRLAWSPDGTKIAAPVGQWVTPEYDNASTSTMIVVVDAATGKEHPLTTRFWDSVSAVEWRRDGTLIVAGNAHGTVNAQLWRVSADTGSIARVTNDLNDYRDAQAAVTAPSLVTILRNRESTLSAGAADHLRPITEGARYDGQTGIAWTPDDRIVFSAAVDGQTDLWITDASGRNPIRLTSDAAAESAPCITADGQSIVFLAEKNGTFGVWRQDINTTSITLLDGNPADNFPFCHPSEQVAFFSRAGTTDRAYRVPLDGGTAEALPIQLSFLGAFGISPDAQSLLTAARVPGKSGWLAAIRPTTASSELRTFDILNVPIRLAWTPRGDAVTFVEHRRGPDTIWNQPVAGGPPVRVVEMPGERIYNFAWARDGRLAIAHGVASDDVVLITGIP